MTWLCDEVSVVSLWPFFNVLTHWGRATHICISKLTTIGSNNGLSPDWRQAIIWTNVGILLIEPLETNFSRILIEIYAFSLKKNALENGGYFVSTSMCSWHPIAWQPWAEICYDCSDSRDIMNGHRTRVFSIQYHQHEPHGFISGGWDDTVQVSRLLLQQSHVFPTHSRQEDSLENILTVKSI